MADSQVKIKVRSFGTKDAYTAVIWNRGSSLESINFSIGTAAGFESSSTVVARDQEGNIVCISDSLPNNIKLDIEGHYHSQPKPESGGVAEIGKALGKMLGFQSKQDRETIRQAQFRGTVLKLENVQAHLSNERTWLAWARTALSALTISFSLLSLADDASAGWLAISLFVVGCFMVFNVIFTFATGWLRYIKINAVLTTAKSDLSEDFNRIGISHHARFLVVLLAAISIFYIAGSSDLL